MICFADPRICESGGVSRILPLGKVTEFEKQLISAALTEITANIEKVLFLLSERFIRGSVHASRRVSRSLRAPSCKIRRRYRRSSRDL